MKKIKIVSLLVVIGIVLISLTGCGKEKHVEGTLSEIMDKLYAGLDSESTPMTEKIDITEDNVSNYVGTTDVTYEEGMASEALIGSIAHSVVLMRSNDPEKTIEQIKSNINPRKWICVWVEDEDVIIKNKGDLVIAIVVKEESIRNKISDNFDNL